MAQTWTGILKTSFWEVMNRLAVLAPRLLATITLILAGWIVAALARRVTLRILKAAEMDSRCARLGLTAALSRAGIRQTPAVLIGRLVFWLLFLVAVLMGVEALELPATAGLVGIVLHFLPNAIVAGLIMVIGWLLANFLAQTTLIAAVNAQVAGAPIIAAATRWLVLVFAGAAALTQLGIAREMVLLAFGIAFGGTTLALALAFGLGGRDLAREILESWLRKRDEESNHISHV